MKGHTSDGVPRAGGLFQARGDPAPPASGAAEIGDQAAGAVSSCRLNRLVRDCHEFVALAVGTAAPSPAVRPGRRKGVGDILHCMAIWKVKRER
jgi:hypothetical protein